MYRGHQFLISRVIDEAKRSGIASVVTTFDRHSHQVLQTDCQPELLPTLDEKLLLLSKIHVGNSFVLYFDTSLVAFSAHDFIQEMLYKQPNVKKLIIGYDNRFGRSHPKTFEDYVQYDKEVGTEVTRTNAFLPDDEKVSSSIIRNDLRTGSIKAANRLLGYLYTIESRTVSGHQSGRKMGLLTANLDASGCQRLLPTSSVYAVMVCLKDSVGRKRGAMNIGHQPTFNDTITSIEVSLFNFIGNLHGQKLLVNSISKVRDEHKPGSLEALAQQLKQDRKQISRLFDGTYRIQEDTINTP